MKIVDPNITTHTTEVIPRFTPIEDISFNLYNESTKVTESITIDAENYTDGILSITYDYTFTDKSKYKIKLYNSEGVIYRGKILATTQDTEDYKETNGLYFYG